jgi:hypothetical protein
MELEKCTMFLKDELNHKKRYKTLKKIAKLNY